MPGGQPKPTSQVSSTASAISGLALKALNEKLRAAESAISQAKAAVAAIEKAQTQLLLLQTAKRLATDARPKWGQGMSQGARRRRRQRQELEREAEEKKRQRELDEGRKKEDEEKTKEGEKKRQERQREAEEQRLRELDERARKEEEQKNKGAGRKRKRDYEDDDTRSQLHVEHVAKDEPPELGQRPLPQTLPALPLGMSRSARRRAKKRQKLIKEAEELCRKVEETQKHWELEERSKRKRGAEEDGEQQTPLQEQGKENKTGKTTEQSSSQVLPTQSQGMSNSARRHANLRAKRERGAEEFWRKTNEEKRLQKLEEERKKAEEQKHKEEGERGTEEASGQDEDPDVEVVWKGFSPFRGGSVEL